MDLSRRKLIQSGVVIGGAIAMTDLALSPAAWAVGGTLTPTNTTLSGRLVRGTPVLPGGYAPVVSVAGELHGVRVDLVPSPGAARAATRTNLLSFAHMTD